MSAKPLDFSKHNLVIDLREVKRMFNEDLSEGGQLTQMRRYLLSAGSTGEEFFHPRLWRDFQQVMAHDLSRQRREGRGGMSGHEGGIGMVIGIVIF